MDDPWGSPWVSSDTASKHDLPAPSPPKTLLSPPPKAFFGTISNISGQSPWADEDGFGDSTRGEQTDNTLSALDWGVWAEPSPRISQSSPKPPESSKASSVAWPGSTSTSPGLRPLPRSRTSSIFRHHSPDPWSMELSLNDRANNHSPTPSNTLRIAAADIKDDLIDEDPKDSALENKPSTIKTQTARNDTQSKKETDGEAAGEQEARDPPSVLDTQPDVNAEPKVEINDTQSRPSSAFSIDSFNGRDRQDSPMTSIDEEPVSRLQTIPRKPSGKVQELVEIFDGLAKTIAEEPPALERRGPSTGRDRERPSSRLENAEDVSPSDFGAFEDARSDYGKPSLDSTTSSERSSTPKASLKSHAIPNQTTKSPDNRTSGPKAHSLPVQHLIEKFGPIRFDINLQAIKDLFPDVDNSINDRSTETSDLPDRVINDSFTEISERKTWYRISRYGSMRLHDYGDEDNYHRVNWSTSRIHSDVIKIVRRWMEEDSLSGRSTLGGSKRTNVFNWDSSAAPVELGKVFARKPSVTLPRASSIPQPTQEPAQALQRVGSGSDTRRSAGGSTNRPNVPSNLSISSCPSFGWSSDANKSPTTRPTSSNNNKIGIPPAVSIPYQTSNQANTSAEDEDDEWGEMVSSPQVGCQASSTTNLDQHREIEQPSQSTVGKHSGHPQLNNGVSTIETVSSNVSRSNNSVPKLSVAIPQTSQAPKQALSLSAASDTKASRADPWPLADFSVFDKSARTPKSSRQDTWPVADFSIFSSPTSRSKPNGTKSLKTKSESGPTKPPEHARPSTDGTIDLAASQMPAVPIKAVLGPVQKSNQDQDKVVQNIIHNLPDLSYMLR
ncbi:hypothetical protein F4779DRAFT_590632 [Xylariaceae sp. FL0662B]|nr:hypothetical protein F4779DRAFT_590632 [Xylariaceae sp. FL0662B]